MRQLELPTEQRINELLEYCPYSGTFLWIRPTKRSMRHGTMAGHKSSIGYIQLRIDKTLYLAHRIAYKVMTGEDPDGEIDHIDHDRSNNAWGNLRLVSHQENCRNVGLTAANKSGMVGVRVRADTGRWTAEICVDGRNVVLGSFSTKEEALAARVAAEKRYGFFDNGKRIMP